MLPGQMMGGLATLVASLILGHCDGHDHPSITPGGKTCIRLTSYTSYVAGLLRAACLEQGTLSFGTLLVLSERTSTQLPWYLELSRTLTLGTTTC